jgi:hypothetical protein
MSKTPLTLYLVRGLPGSGKTTYAHALADRLRADGLPPILCAADDFFVGADGVYRYDPARLGDAHAACQRRAVDVLDIGHPAIVHNTCTTAWEAAIYAGIALALDAELQIHSLYDADLDDEALCARNIHGIPISAITRMRSRYDGVLPFPHGLIES